MKARRSPASAEWLLSQPQWYRIFGGAIAAVGFPLPKRERECSGFEMPFQAVMYDLLDCLDDLLDCLARPWVRTSVDTEGVAMRANLKTRLPVRSAPETESLRRSWTASRLRRWP